MAEYMDLVARLTAEDEASPKFQKLLGNLKKVQDQLNKNNAKSPITNAIADNQKLLDHLEAKNGGAVRRITDSRIRYFAAMQKEGKLTESVFRNEMAAIERLTSVFDKVGRLSLGDKKELRKHIQNAEAIKAVWNRAAEKRIADTHRMRNATLSFEQGVLQAEQKRHNASARADRDQEVRKRAAERTAELARKSSLSWQRLRMRIMHNSYVAEERLAAEAQRADDKRLRRSIMNTNRLFAIRQRHERMMERSKARASREMMGGVRGVASAPGRIADRLENPFFTSPLFASMVASGAAVQAARTIMGAETKADDAEINMRIAGKGTGENGHLSFGEARDIRNNWAAPTGLTMGATAADMMTAYTEALKVGIPDEGAKLFAGLSKKVSEALGIGNDETNEVLGTINSQLISKGKPFDLNALNGVANSMVYLADKMSTTPEKMISFMRKGAGAGASLGMSPDIALAFGAAATSMGMQAGSAGRLFDFMVGRITNMPQLVKQKGEGGKGARNVIHELGYGSVNNMLRAKNSDPDNFIFDLIERFGKIKDSKKRQEAIRFFAGQEWFGELSQMVEGKALVKEAKDLAVQARQFDAIGARWELHKQKLSFLGKQISAGYDAVLGEFGEELAPVVREAGDYVMRAVADVRAGNLRLGFKRLIDGAIEGLIGKPGTITNVLEMFLGKRGGGLSVNPETFYSFAKGFSSGLMNVYTTIKTALQGMASMAGFDSSSAESMGRFISELLGFSVAMHFAKPAFSALGAVADVLIAFGSALTIFRGAKALIGMGALASRFGELATFLGGAAMTGGIAGLVRLTGAIGGLIAIAQAASKLNVFSPGSTGVFSLEGLLRLLDPGIANRIYGNRKDDAGNRPEQKWFPWFRKNTAFEGDGPERGLLQNASFREFTDPVREMSADFKEMGARLQLASFGMTAASASSIMGGGAFGLSAPAAAGGGGGGGSVNSFGLGRRGIIGGGSGNNYGTPSRSLLDFIAKSEGADYNVSWGNGRFMPGGREQNLTGKSLNEILALGNYMRAQPGSRNSSAMGRYQITGSTLRDLMGRMHLTGNEKFDQEMQDALASRLIQDEGPRALQRWEGLKIGGRMSQAQALLRSGQIASVPGNAADLPLKSAEAMAGGASSAGVIDMAKSLVALNVPGGMGQFTALNDAYHHGANPRSKHTQGLAADFTIKDASKSTEAAERVRELFRAAGLAENTFKVIDEYKNPSSHATGGHIHYQLNNQEAARTYAEYAAAHRGGSDPAKLAAGLDAGDDRSTRSRASEVPSHAGKGNTYVTQHIQGGTNDPEALANKVQRRVREEQNRRTMDVETI